MSGALYYPLATSLGLIAPPSSAPGLTTGLGAPPQVPFRPYDINVTNSADQEVEPSIIGVTIGGTTYTASTYARFASGHYSLWCSRRNETAGVTDVVAPLPINPSYSGYGDPFLDANIYSGGVAPGRVYNVGIMHNGQGVAPNAIGLWYSDDGGGSWLGPTLVAVNTQTNVFLDKPAVVVSPAGNSLGWVYVVYSQITSISPTFATFQLRVARSTDGGLSFSGPSVVDSNRDGGQQILVAPNTGYVLAIWADYTTQQIRMAQSPDFGNSWFAPETAATASVAFYEQNIVNTFIRVNTLVNARFNIPNNRVCLVWYEPDSLGRAQVYYTSKGPGGWQPKVPINDSGVNDHFMPSLGWNSDGTGLVSFYDSREDPGNTQYKLYAAKIDINGNRPGANFAISTFPSSAQYYIQNFIGDYQQTWPVNLPGGERWIASFIANPVIAQLYYGDVWLAYVF